MIKLPPILFIIAALFFIEKAVDGQTIYINNLTVQSMSVVSSPATATTNAASLNVTNFGAIGDAVQLFVNTTTNSNLATTTNTVPASAVGDVIEIYRTGLATYGPNENGVTTNGNMDTFGTITSISNGTNIYMSVVASNTLTQTFATYGFDNRVPFQNTINALGKNTGITINVPAGNYLLIPTNSPGIQGYAAVVVNHGGFTMTGAGTNQTTLLGRFAWYTNTADSIVHRGYMFEENGNVPTTGPITNYSSPAIFENMTLDGGYQSANSGVTTYNGANTVTGRGWDITSDAWVVWSYPDFSQNLSALMFTNLVFQHWGGEMVKSVDHSTNENLTIVNCTFNDGNATALNIYASLSVSNDLFNNLIQCAELRPEIGTNRTIFANNVVTNISANVFAVDGAAGPTDPYFYFENNDVSLKTSGLNGLELVPADNTVVSNNYFRCLANNTTAIKIDPAGGVGIANVFGANNITITGNTFSNAYSMVALYGGQNAADTTNSCINIWVTNNTAIGALTDFAVSYYWMSNIVFAANDCSSFNPLGTSTVQIYQLNNVGNPYVTIATNNNYWTWKQDGNVTNNISYSTGSKYYARYTTAGVGYVIQNVDGTNIPAGAQLVFANQAGFNIPIFPNSITSNQVTVANNDQVELNWHNTYWSTN